jgi:hypothetical protein
MQKGSLITSNRRNGEKVWEFRWRDRTSGKAVYRRIVLGTTQQFVTETAARAAVAGIVLEINVDDPRLADTQAHDIPTGRALPAQRAISRQQVEDLLDQEGLRQLSEALDRSQMGGRTHSARCVRLKWSCGYSSFPWPGRLARRSRTS